MSAMMMSYFTQDELKCQHCGEYKFDNQALNELNQIREVCGFPFIINSAYRCPKHPIEEVKSKPGEHTTGQAVDIKADGEQAYKIIQAAMSLGVPRVGVSQKSGGARFVHLGWDVDFPNPRVWSY